MNKLITIKNRKTGAVDRFVGSVFEDMKQKGVQSLQDWHKVPKKLYKRQQRDQNRIRSKRKPSPFGSKLAQRLAEKYGTKSVPIKKTKLIQTKKLSFFQKLKVFLYKYLKIKDE